MSNENQPVVLQTVTDDDGFDIQKLLVQVLRFWWLYVLCIVLAFTCVFLYLRYSTSLYKIEAKLLVTDSKKGGNVSGAEIFEELGLFDNHNSVDNEVELLKSRTLMEKTVQELQLNVKYFATGTVKKSEIFGYSVPFTLSLADIKDDSLSKGKTFDYTHLDNTHYQLKYQERLRTVKYGDTVVYPFGKMSIARIYRPGTIQGPINIHIARTDDAVADFLKKLSVKVTSKTVSTIDLSLDESVPMRGELLLNNLIKIYRRLNTEDKNRIADSTISFINNRLVYVTQELGSVEKDIENFRKDNQLTDLSLQGKLLLENSSQYLKDLSVQQVQLEVISSLQSFLNNPKNTDETIPAGMAIPDPTFATMVQTYNSLQLDKQRQLQTTTEKNPVIQKIDVQLTELKSEIQSILSTIKRTINISLTHLNEQGNKYESTLKQVPKKERTFLEFSRQQAIKQELYLYLLKKQEETAVSKAANIDNARVVDAPKANRIPFTPIKSTLYLFGLIFGLALPSLVLYLRALLNNKVESKKDVTSITSAPIIGEIASSPFKERLVVKENLRHPIAEQFRLLISNLNFMFTRPPHEKGRTIFLTSNISGEGKSFVATNLAALLAIGGKKVVLIEFDLRKPKLSQSFGVENNLGISNFLINQNDEILKMVKPVGDINGLYLLSSGPIPPNPAELMSGPRTKILFQKLREEFDYVITDLPPIGVVTDAQLLAEYCDVCIYLVRQGYTYKEQLEFLQDLYVKKRFPNMGIVVNDLKHMKGYGYAYGYGYGYDTKTK